MSKEASKAVLLFGKSIIKKHEVFTMKTKEELNKIKEEVEAVNEKLVELTEEELKQVTGGDTARNWGKIGDDWDKYVCDF